MRNITFLGLVTTLSEKELCWNELWARHNALQYVVHVEYLSGTQHAQHTVTTSCR